MRKCLPIIIAVCLLLTSCSSKFAKPPYMKNHETASPAATNAREADQTVDIYAGDIFSASKTESLQGIQGSVYPRKTKTVTQREYMELIRRPRAFAKIYIGNACGVLLTNSNNLLVYTLYYDPYKNDETREISYYELPDFLSDDVIIEDTTALLDGVTDRVFETAMKGDMSSTGIILDRKNGILLSFSVNKDELTINSAEKLKTDISDFDLKSAFCYETGKTKSIVFTDKYGRNHLINARSLESQKNEKDRFLAESSDIWQAVGGVREKESATGSNYLYLYNRHEHSFQKRSIDGDKIYEIDLSKTPIQGDMIKVVNTGEDHGLYILCKEGKKPVIWYVNEKNWNKIGKITQYADGTEFRNIDDIRWMVRNESNMYIVAFDSMSVDYPTRDVSLSYITTFELSPDVYR